MKPLYVLICKENQDQVKEKFHDFLNIQESEGVSIAFKLPSGKNTTYVFHKDSTVKVRFRKTFKYLCSFNLLFILGSIQVCCKRCYTTIQFGYSYTDSVTSRTCQAC